MLYELLTAVHNIGTFSTVLSGCYCFYAGNDITPGVIEGLSFMARSFYFDFAFMLLHISYAPVHVAVCCYNSFKSLDLFQNLAYNNGDEGSTEMCLTEKRRIAVLLFFYAFFRLSLCYFFNSLIIRSKTTSVKNSEYI